MLKNISNSKLFFVALGVTIALCGMRAFAGPATQSNADMENLNRNIARIATSLEKIQRDGIQVEVKQPFGTKFEVKVDK